MIVGCEYCGRSLYLSEGDNCKGCGAPVMARNAPAIMYDATVFTGNTMKFLARPGVNIPVDLDRLPQQGKKLSDIYHGR